jgi:hypothetical protein
VSSNLEWLCQQQTEYFKTKIDTRDEACHYIMIEMSTHKGYITIINIYAFNNKAPKYINQNLIELKGETVQQ